MDECDSESDDDDEVVAFVDESDSETEVPVNTLGSTRTRAGRLSIPNSRYLDWLAMFLLNMSLEISNIYSVLSYRYLFSYFL